MKLLNWRRLGIACLLAALLATGMATTVRAETFNPYTSSQSVACNLVDQAIAGIPHGDGAGPVTNEEVGPGGWRFNTTGQSFVTFAYSLNENQDGYVVVAGRSNVAANSGVINDYPHTLDLPQGTDNDVLTFKGRNGSIVLSDGPGFSLPGGSIRINVHDPDGDGIYTGCAKSPLLENQGFVVAEGGDFVQREYFKVSATTNSDGVVTSYEWTEISTFKNTNPDGN